MFVLYFVLLGEPEQRRLEWEKDVTNGSRMVYVAGFDEDDRVASTS